MAERGEPADAVDHRLVVADPEAGWECCAVVVDGDRVVSTALLLDETLLLGGVPIPAGQVELVATDREYEGRGLVRALMGWAHERSARRGHLMQVMIGIPYFYRQFAYEYSIAMPNSRAVRALPPPPDGYRVRPAGPDDVPAMVELQDAAQQGYDLRMPHSPACWRWLVARDGSTQLLVERDDVAVATARITPPDDDVVLLGEVAAADPVAAHALLAHAATLAGLGGLSGGLTGGPSGGLSSRLQWSRNARAASAGTPWRAVTGPAAATGRPLLHPRAGDVVALLDHLRPVLSARLAASGQAEGSGEAVVSFFFRHHVRLAYTDGKVNEVRPGTTDAASGLGGRRRGGPRPGRSVVVRAFKADRRGAERHPDAYLGPNEALMRALFRPVRTDLLTFYLP